MSIDALGLREQKKRETRQAISDHATRLFVERGFERTTISDIAAASRVAKMTVTNYFPRKEDMALDHHEEFVASLAETVRQRAAGESALAALRHAFLSAVERRDPVIGFAPEPFARMIADSPTLVARLRDLHEQREEALAAELGGDLRARAAAGMLAGVHRVLFAELMRRTLEREDADADAAAMREAATTAFDLLEPSLGGYAVREA
ncbi:TetR/AcrR family transcriptional regulator [Nonomuraea sp. NPDC059194]|uniref:TetR/AcrR family transcriptional regulator n=1 Tax=Nonomuraea sp. NPDC059194 TaxID=3346764 RepID=UPI0036C18CAF